MAFPDDIDLAKKSQTCNDDDPKGALSKMNKALGPKRNSGRAAKGSSPRSQRSLPLPATPPPAPENTKNIVGANTISLSSEGRRSAGPGFAGSTAGNVFRTVCSSGRIEVRQ